MTERTEVCGNCGSSLDPCGCGLTTEAIRLRRHNETLRTRLTDAESRARLATSRAERAEGVVATVRVEHDGAHVACRLCDALRILDRHAETTAPEVTHAKGCMGDCGDAPPFTCADCERVCASCFGAADDRADVCDDCYARGRGAERASDAK